MHKQGELPFADELLFGAPPQPAGDALAANAEALVAGLGEVRTPCRSAPIRRKLP